MELFGSGTFVSHCLTADDLEMIARRLVDLGGDVRWQTRTGSADTITDVVFLTDPHGVRIELISMPGDPMAPPGADGAQVQESEKTERR